MIQLLPNGYDTEIQEDGDNLSGGQRQRIGFARAVFGEPCVVILDEPDANLDSPGRSKLRNSLPQLRRRTHRLYSQLIESWPNDTVTLAHYKNWLVQIGDHDHASNIEDAIGIADFSESSACRQHWPPGNRAAY